MRGGGGGDLPWNVCRGGGGGDPPTLEGVRGGVVVTYRGTCVGGGVVTPPTLAGVRGGGW